MNAKQYNINVWNVALSITLGITLSFLIISCETFFPVSFLQIGYSVFGYQLSTTILSVLLVLVNNPVSAIEEKYDVILGYNCDILKMIYRE